MGELRAVVVMVSEYRLDFVMQSVVLPLLSGTNDPFSPQARGGPCPRPPALPLLVSLWVAPPVCV